MRRAKGVIQLIVNGVEVEPIKHMLNFKRTGTWAVCRRGKMSDEYIDGGFTIGEAISFAKALNERHGKKYPYFVSAEYEMN